METQQSYTFDSDEIHVLSEALMMYSSYMDAIVLPNLVGDEADRDSLTAEAALAKGMAVNFFNKDGEYNWQQEKAAFAERHDRPMEHSDLSAFDFHEYAFGESEEDSNGDVSSPKHLR